MKPIILCGEIRKMEDYVNVNFFWGGEIIRRDNDIRYSEDPKEMRYIKWGTSYEELREVVFGVMQISPSYWNVKLSFKYPQLGIGNLVTGYYLRYITSDDDVKRMLSIPRQMQMGLGDVSMYIEADKIVLDEPYSYEQPWYPQPSQQNQPSQQSLHHDYEMSQFSDYGTPGWSDQFFVGGYNCAAFQGYGAGSSSQVVQNFQQGGYSQVEEYSGGNIGMELSPPRKAVSRGAGRELACIDENDDQSSSSEDSREFGDDSEDDSEDEDEESPRPTVVTQEHHVPRVGWFETEEYNPVAVVKRNETGLIFDAEHDELSVGALFCDKETLIAAVREAHISTDRNYHLERSNPKKFKVKCAVPSCPWKLRAAKKEKHAMFEITVCPYKHTCLVNEPMQDHRRISAKMICRVVKPYVSYIYHYYIYSYIFRTLVMFSFS